MDKCWAAILIVEAHIVAAGATALLAARLAARLWACCCWSLLPRLLAAFRKSSLLLECHTDSNLYVVQLGRAAAAPMDGHERHSAIIHLYLYRWRSVVRVWIPWTNVLENDWGGTDPLVGLLACRPSFVCSGQFALSYYIGQSVHDVVMEILIHFLLKLINRGKEVVTERFEWMTRGGGGFLNSLVYWAIGERLKTSSMVKDVIEIRMLHFNYPGWGS